MPIRAPTLQIQTLITNTAERRDRKTLREKVFHRISWRNQLKTKFFNSSIRSLKIEDISSLKISFIRTLMIPGVLATLHSLILVFYKNKQTKGQHRNTPKILKFGKASVEYPSSRQPINLRIHLIYILPSKVEGVRNMYAKISVHILGIPQKTSDAFES